MTVMTTDKKKTSFFREVQNELKKVSWTSKQEIIFCTKSVIFATFLFGFAIYAVDLVIRGAFNGIGALFRAILG